MIMSEKIVATIRLVDGSAHDAVFEEDIQTVKENITNRIKDGNLLKITNPKYGDIFGDDYIVGSKIVAFRLSEGKK